jgi:hypothetical protein
VGTGKRGGQVSELNCVESVVARSMYRDRLTDNVVVDCSTGAAKTPMLPERASTDVKPSPFMIGDCHVWIEGRKARVGASGFCT